MFKGTKAQVIEKLYHDTDVHVAPYYIVSSSDFFYDKVGMAFVNFMMTGIPAQQWTDQEYRNFLQG